MQHEFNNRIAAQRAILSAVNRKPWNGEQLFGLSSKAIDRWVFVNRIDPESFLVKYVKDVSAKLFFLANRSQEQVSDEYTAVRAEIVAASDAIKIELEASHRGDRDAGETRPPGDSGLRDRTDRPPA